MTNVVFARGDAVTLHPLQEADLEFVCEGVNHPAVRPHVGQSFPTSLAREQRYFEEASQTLDVVQALVSADGQRVGVVEFDPVDRDAGVAEFTVWVHPDHQGNGYAREATELMLDYAFDELRMHKVTANAFAGNDASRALLESVGFTREGVGREDAYVDGGYRDTHYYGVLAREWTGADAEDP
ncbi:MAG: GNAT family N-acetyltransferase [Halobacteriaceae archaeon]